MLRRVACQSQQHASASSFPSSKRRAIQHHVRCFIFTRSFPLNRVLSSWLPRGQLLAWSPPSLREPWSVACTRQSIPKRRRTMRVTGLRCAQTAIRDVGYQPHMSNWQDCLKCRSGPLPTLTSIRARLALMWPLMKSYLFQTRCEGSSLRVAGPTRGVEPHR